jgi:hypothetical protein
MSSTYLEKEKGLSKGLWIELAVIDEKALCWIEKIIYSIIYNFNINGYECFEGNAAFADICQISKGRASEYIARLIKKKYITAEYFYKGKEIKKRVLTVTAPLRNSGIPLRFSSIPIPENDEDNNINNNKIKKTISKDIESSDKLTKLPKKKKQISEEKEIPTNELVEFWNSVSTGAKHKNPSTAVYRDAVKMFKRLQNGTFDSHHPIDIKFIKQHSISADIIKRKWTKEQIKEGLTKLAEGINTLPNASKVKKFPLRDLLRHYEYGSSYFFRFAGGEQKQYTIKNKEVYNLYADLFHDRIKSTREKNCLISSVNGITEEVTKLHKKLDRVYRATSFRTYFGSAMNPIPFFKSHIAFLKDRNKLDPNYLQFNFKDFVIWAEKEHGYKLYPTEKEMKALLVDMKRQEVFFANSKRSADKTKLNLQEEEYE